MAAGVSLSGCRSEPASPEGVAPAPLPPAGSAAPAPTRSGAAPADPAPAAGATPTPPPAEPPQPAPAPLACADGVTRWHARGLLELETRGVGALRGSRPAADHFTYVCEGGRLARIERRDGSGALEGDGGFAVERLTLDVAPGGPLRVSVERLDAAERPAGHVELVPVAPDRWTRTEHDATGAVALREELTVRGGLVVERRPLDAPGLPTTRTHRGPAGELLRTSWHGADGAPTADPRGVFAVRVAWDARGFPVEETFLDAAGAPTADSTGLSTLRFTRDHAGNELERTRLGPDGRPAPTTEGVVTLRTRRDPLGHAIAEDKLDGAGNPVAGFRGIAGSTMQVDARGRLVRIGWHDLEGRPVADGTGIAAYGWDYTDDPVEGRKRFFLADGTEVERHGKPLPPPQSGQ